VGKWGRGKKRRRGERDVGIRRVRLRLGEALPPCLYGYTWSSQRRKGKKNQDALSISFRLATEDLVIPINGKSDLLDPTAGDIIMREETKKQEKYRELHDSNVGSLAVDGELCTETQDRYRRGETPSRVQGRYWMRASCHWTKYLNVMLLIRGVQ
jgi:hypothetical protein